MTHKVDFRSNLYAQSPLWIPYPLSFSSHSLLCGDQPSRTTEPRSCSEHYSHCEGGPWPHGCGKFYVLPDDPGSQGMELERNKTGELPDPSRSIQKEAKVRGYKPVSPST